METYQLDPRKLIQPKTDEKGVESEDQRDNNIHLPRWLDLKTINPHYSKIRKIDEREFHSLGDFDTGDWCLFKMIVGSLETFDGYLRQDYVQSSFGRYFGRRVNENLQLIPNRLLPFLIPNTFDYDLRAACFSLIGQVSQRHRPEQRTNTIQDYVKNKTEIRRHLSKEIGVDGRKIIRERITLRNGVYCIIQRPMTSNGTGYILVKVTDDGTDKSKNDEGVTIYEEVPHDREVKTSVIKNFSGPKQLKPSSQISVSPLDCLAVSQDNKRFYLVYDLDEIEPKKMVPFQKNKDEDDEEPPDDGVNENFLFEKSLSNTDIQDLINSIKTVSPINSVS